MTAKTDLVDFVLYTADKAWIKRHNGRTRSDGRVTVKVPAGKVEAIKLGGTDHLRHRFADVPEDARNRSIVCPTAWVPQTAKRFTFEAEGIPSQVLEFMRQQGRR